MPSSHGHSAVVASALGHGQLQSTAAHMTASVCMLQVVCPKGHYCKRGSTSPTRCPPLMTCEERSEVPSDNYSGLVLDLLMFDELWLVSMWYRW